MLVDVAVLSGGLHDPLTYAVPVAMQARAQPGVRVVVRVGTRRVTGLLLGATAQAPAGVEVKPLASILDDTPVVTSAQLQLLRFVARYYAAPMGDAARLVMPPDTADAPLRRYALTEQGEQARVLYARFGLTPNDVALLGAFDVDEIKDERQLRRIGGTPERIRRLLERGLLDEKGTTSPVSSVRVVETLVPVPDAPPLPSRLPALAAFDAWVRAFTTTETRPPTMAEAQSALPGARGKAKRLRELGRLRIDEAPREVVRRAGVVGKAGAESLTDAQQRAVDAVITALAHEGSPSTSFLLEGVTGSGKTEVYLHALRACLQRGRGAILIVPEIALTPQLLARVQHSVDEDVAILHSDVPPGERRDVLARVRSGAIRVVVGARSAIFAPVASLGLIVVDEEHEGSLKQDEAPRYHARDVALWRAQHEGAVCVLGSATPALETRHNVAQGKLVHLELPARFGAGGALPIVEIIDLRARKEIKLSRALDRAVADDHGGIVLSQPLVQKMADTLAAGDQVLLFLNRRGWSTTLMCEACGEVQLCPQCSVSLTLHRRRPPVLLCHLCGFVRPHAPACASCHNEALVPMGTGTERVEAEVQARFPDARVARLDKDSTSKAGELVRVLHRIQQREVDVVIGTQMVAKGHDWPGVHMVGVVNADVALSLPDFRAAERAMSLLTQVAGRAGRGEHRGVVVVQTLDPDHPVLQHLVAHDARGFALQELEARRALRWPPFARAALIRVEAEDDRAAMDLANDVGAVIRAAASTLPAGWQVLGPAPCPIERIQNRFRVQLFVRTPGAADRLRLLDALRADRDVERARARANARLVVDVDPISML